MAVGVHVAEETLSFELNPNPRVQIRTVGNEGHRLVIVDDVYADLAKVQELAWSLDFTDDKALVYDFPGMRGYLGWDNTELIHAMAGWYGKELAPTHPNIPFIANHSVARSWHNPSQRQPHTDDAIASFIYLNPADQCTGGTGLYRHAGSGFEWIPFVPTKKVLRYAQQLGHDINDLRIVGGYEQFAFEALFNPDFAAPFPELIDDGNTYWEQFAFVEMVPNRLVMYDGRIPHSMVHGPAEYEKNPRILQMCAMSRDYANRPTRHA